jgi:Ribonuclease G/E
MSERRLYIDYGPGETRGVVTLNGRPERLLIERPGEGEPLLEERWAARVTQVDKAQGLAFLDMDGHVGVLRLKADRPPPAAGELLDVEVLSEARRGKGAVTRAVGAAEGTPRRLKAAPDVATRLQTYGRGRAFEGAEARDVADEAEAEALAIEHPLPGGGTLAIEPTRALVAIDVDLGGRPGLAQETKKAARTVNVTAIAEIARLLRLKSLGGLIVIDLVGRGHDGQALANAARNAFSADQPGVVIGPITKFGALELALPQRARPIAERLLGPDGRATVMTVAVRLLRALEREGRADGGARLEARCAPEVAAAVEAASGRLAERLGRRFQVSADEGLDRESYVVGRI